VAVRFNYNDDRFHVNGNNNWDNNNGHSREMTLASKIFNMKTYKNIYQTLCSYDNLFYAYEKARKRKTLKPYVIEFEENLDDNLELLRTELLLHSYRPQKLTNFIVRDPKTRKISKSAFRDRVIHHVLFNLIEPIFEKQFICDSFANRKGKGTLKAVERFDKFKRQVSKNNTQSCYVLKADIKHYFDEVDHDVLLNVIKKNIGDNYVLLLIKTILDNHNLSLSLSLSLCALPRAFRERRECHSVI
jgi:retron-type reverse transcriptase